MSTPDLDLWQFTLDGLLLGDGTPYEIVDFDGLGTMPDVSDQDEDTLGDGEYTGTDTVRGRTITLELEVAATPDVSLADALDQLEMASRPKRDVDLWARIMPWSTPRRAGVRVRHRDMPTDATYAAGLTTVTLQLKAADPVLYGPDDAGASTGFPVQAGGLLFPLYTDGAGTTTGYLDFGPAPTTGTLLLTNTGTADVWPSFDVQGPVPAAGFAILRTDTGALVQFEGPVADGAHLVIDSSDGSAIIDGTADRGGQLTWRQFWSIGAHESVELVFLNLGDFSAATLTAHAPSGWW